MSILAEFGSVRSRAVVPLTEKDKQLGQALGRIPSGLFIVTAKYGSLVTGFLASWVQQASFEPPLVSVAVKKGRPILALFQEGCVFVVHVLGKQNRKLVRHFLKGFSLEENAFEGLRVVPGENGAPILEEAHAFLECDYYGHFEAGDHILFLGKVSRGGVTSQDEEPLFHTRPTGFHY